MDSLTLDSSSELIGSEETPPGETLDAGEVVQNPLEPVAGSSSPSAAAGPPSSGYTCEWCGKVCKKKGGLVRHQQSCKARPAHIPAPVGRRARAKAADIDPPPRSSAPEAPLPPPKRLNEWTATEGAARAAAMVDDVSAEGGSVVDVMARMDAEQVGVPDLIALVCLRALPPPLSDEEYQALRMAYRDRGVKLPPWLMTLVVTLAVLGPRVAAHPVAGPWLREQLVGKRTEKKRAAVVTPPPPPPPPPPPKPSPEPEDTAEKAKDAIRRAMEGMR
jgi:hypothetical protein